MSEIRNLEPKLLWKYFDEITQIPRPSKKEKKMIEYMKKFGAEHGLETIVDQAGNVIIRKRRQCAGIRGGKRETVHHHRRREGLR